MFNLLVNVLLWWIILMKPFSFSQMCEIFNSEIWINSHNWIKYFIYLFINPSWIFMRSSDLFFWKEWCLQLVSPNYCSSSLLLCFACYIPSWFKGMKHARSLKSNGSKLWVLNLNSLWESKIWNVIKKKSIRSTYFKHVLDYS